MANNMSKEQMLRWAANCRAAAERYRAEGNIERAMDFEEGANGFDFSLEKQRAHLSFVREKRSIRVGSRHRKLPPGAGQSQR